MLTRRQMQWAACRDWFVAAKEFESGWAVTCYESVDDSFVTFTDYQELRNWAGY